MRLFQVRYVNKRKIILLLIEMNEKHQKFLSW
jgi:hypothetical protein